MRRECRTICKRCEDSHSPPVSLHLVDKAGSQPVEEEEEAEFDKPERCVHEHEGDDSAV